MHRLEVTGPAAGVLDLEHLRFTVDRLHAVARIRVVAQELRSAAATLFLDRLEHAGHRPRVVPRPGHDLRPEQVGLALVLTAVLQEHGAEPELRALRDDRTGPSADHRAEHLAGEGAELELLPLGRLGRAVAQGHVRDLVRHHPRHFGFGLGRLDHAAVQEHRSARQRERVDLPEIDDVEAVAELRLTIVGRDGLDETVADPLREVLDALVVQHRHLLTDFRGRLLPELDVLLGGVTVLVPLDAGLRNRRDGNGGRQERHQEQPGFA